LSDKKLRLKPYERKQLKDMAAKVLCKQFSQADILFERLLV